MMQITAIVGRRVCIIAAACVVLALFVAGCGRTKDDGVTLRLSIWGDLQEQRMVEDIVKAYEASNPGVTVEIEAAPAMQIAGGITAYEQKLIVLMAAQDAPDVMYLPRDRYEFYAEKGALVDLEPFIEKSGGMDKLPPELVNGMRVGSGIYGLAKDEATVCAISVQTKHSKEAWALLLSIATGGR
ncbi:MAG: ABC transporter substrate-binding protein [Betaproteobacteria bacterium]